MTKPLLLLIFGLITLTLLALPSPSFATTYTVTKTADTNDGTCDADCSLREAITAANNNAGADTVEFAIPTSDPNWNTPNFPNSFAVQFSSGSLSITDSETTIDGTSQSLSTGDSIKSNYVPGLISENYDGSSNGPEIILDFSLYSGPNYAIRIDNEDITIKNLGFYNFPAYRRPIWLRGSINPARGFNLIENDFLDITQGVIYSSSILAAEVSIVGNVFKEVSRDPTTSFVFDAFEYSLGAGSEFKDNLFHNILSNVINLSSGSDVSIYNNIFSGVGQGEIRTSAIFVDGFSKAAISNNFFINIAGTGILLDNEAGQSIGNVISNNQFSEVDGMAIDHNYLSTTVDGGNLNYGDGPTPNDPGDTDTGPNDLMNYPVITHANHLGDGSYAVGGYLDGNPAEAPFTIELCKSDNHSSGHGGCIQSLATTTTDTGDYWEVFVTIPGDSDTNLSTFSTLATNSNGSTSEFSQNFTAVQANPLVFPTPPQPDIAPTQSGIISKANIVTITQPNTFNYEAVLSLNLTAKHQPFQLTGTRWWQATDNDTPRSKLTGYQRSFSWSE